MLHSEREEFVQAVVDKFLMPVLRAKGRDYANSRGAHVEEAEDANYNFVLTAERMKGRGWDKYDVWFCFFEKHLQALETYLNSNTGDGRRQVESEAIHMRITDLINYLLILWSMGVDDGTMDDPRKADSKASGVNESAFQPQLPSAGGA